ncbi:S8 family serine peptidase [Alteraurantiacibacter buctensis]|uniref:S8 family serine peptidase n=1 Tax=Alteraurantiacibacter buctensis TaxID=1503981 RepID=UPI00301D31C1
MLDPLEGVTGAIDEVTADSVRDLLRLQQRTLARFVRQNRQSVELDRSGQPARRGELLLMDLDDASAAALASEGLRLLGREEIEGLDIAVTRLALPSGMSLPDAQELAARLAPAAVVAPDNLHFQSGSAPIAVLQRAAAARAQPGPAVGMIDGAPADSQGTFVSRGFATGAPTPSNHGSAIVHLLQQAGVRDIRVADVYGTDPAGGGALAIARALGWLVAGGSRVVTISLVGPRNPVLERAVTAAGRRGVVVVAAVGNNGPAAPPAYPASYPGVVAVTGVDGRNRALLEAGRALHLDYAAPGADLFGRDARGRRVRLRGTSYATPLVAARIAAALRQSANWRRTVDEEARDLGAPGPDASFGRGLVCGTCGRS